ncbi:NTP transferase domain-containing protein [Candidatus Kaiserbacteria bacterium]|nr:NTP transferase domain-containing protein [Candidatus Kaiserbacteria bacterium]
MKAVILAAGRGLRMDRFTKDIPKALVTVNGKSILERTLACLPQAVTECIIVLGYKGESIREKIGTLSCGRRITYAYQKVNLTGTGGSTCFNRACSCGVPALFGCYGGRSI